MDLSQYSTEELKAMVTPTVDPQEELSTYSTEDLLKMSDVIPQDPTLNQPGQTSPQGIIEHPEVGIQREAAAMDAQTKADYEQRIATDPDFAETERFRKEQEFEVTEGGATPSYLELDALAGPLKIGAGVVAAGVGIKLLKGLPRSVKHNLTKAVTQRPEQAQDLLDTLLFMKQNNIRVSRDLWEKEGLAKTGNAWVDAKLKNVKDDFYDIEYDTIDKLMTNISKEAVTTKQVSQKFAKEMEAKYEEFQEVGKQAWNTFGESIGGKQPLTKAQQTQLLKNIDGATTNADSTVNSFLKRTLFKNKEAGQLTISDLDQELKILNNRMTGFNRKNLSNAEKLQKTRLGAKIRKQMRDIAKAENELNKQPLELADLIEAKKMINNKTWVTGGAISTKNKLERKHLKAANKELDKMITSIAPKETLEQYEVAKTASRNMFDTFGYALDGKNMGKKLDTSGSVIAQQGKATIDAFKTELLDEDLDKALVSFKKYKELLGDKAVSVKEAEKLYVSKIFGLDPNKITKDLTGEMGLQLSDEALSAGLKKALGSESGRTLSKEIFGEEGFKKLVAIKRLDGIIKKNIAEGKTGFWKEALSDFNGPTGGLIKGAYKLIKALTWDSVTYPMRDGGRAYTAKKLNYLVRELEKKNPNSRTVKGFMRQLMGEINDPKNRPNVSNILPTAGAFVGGAAVMDSQASSFDDEVAANAAKVKAVEEGPYVSLEDEMAAEGKPLTGDKPEFNPQDFVKTEQDFKKIVERLNDSGLKAKAIGYARQLILIHGSRKKGETILGTIERVAGETPPQDFMDTYHAIYGK